MEKFRLSVIFAVLLLLLCACSTGQTNNDILERLETLEEDNVMLKQELDGLSNKNTQLLDTNNELVNVIDDLKI